MDLPAGASLSWIVEEGLVVGEMGGLDGSWLVTMTLFLSILPSR